MTDFAVTGKKRTGKGLFCAGLIRDALKAGKRVATNMDIFPDAMLSPLCKATFYRLPDCPTVADLEAIGSGNDIVDDEKNGIIVLDEASKFFNARSWGDKERQPMLDWLIHSGKLGWDVYYQMQGLEQVDKQLRTTQVEFSIAVKRTDRWPIPIISPLTAAFGYRIGFPKFHMGVYRQGCDRDSIIVERKFYRCKDLYTAYDTRQVFLDRDHPEAVGLHSVLSAWHVKGRYLPTPPPYILRFIYGVIGYDWTKETQSTRQRPPLKPKLPLVIQLSKLDPDAAVANWRRFEALGAFES